MAAEKHTAEEKKIIAIYITRITYMMLKLDATLRKQLKKGGGGGQDNEVTWQ